MISGFGQFMMLRRFLWFLMTMFVVLAGCTQAGPPPLVNSGSYDWRDAYWGSNGYRLPGWRL